MNKLPKIHLGDSGLGGRLLGLTERTVSRRSPVAMTEFGHLLETFAINELLKQASWIEESLRYGHYRTFDGHEVALVIEHYDGRCFAVEIKAGASYRPDDLRSLRLYVLPLDQLWSS